LAAYEGGANRIEICAALGEGGVTPSHGLIRAAIAAANGLPVYVLLRPRTGNFVYSDGEFKIICVDLEHAASLGVAGFATGILDAQGNVDSARMRALVKLAGEKQVTFHRAFDHTQNLREALEEIIAVGCRRVLTSGGGPTVGEGMSTIADLATQAGNRLRIAAGGGLTPAIACKLRSMAAVDLHVSLRRKRRRSSGMHDPLWDPGNAATEILVSDVQALASILSSPRGRS
jgi:copper homeostasis protein